MKSLLPSWFWIAFLFVAVAGCSEPQSTNVMENADAQAFADYERMIAEDANAQDSESKEKPGQ